MHDNPFAGEEFNPNYQDLLNKFNKKDFDINAYCERVVGVNYFETEYLKYLYGIYSFAKQSNNDFASIKAKIEDVSFLEGYTFKSLDTYNIIRSSIFQQTYFFLAMSLEEARLRELGWSEDVQFTTDEPANTTNRKALARAWVITAKITDVDQKELIKMSDEFKSDYVHNPQNNLGTFTSKKNKTRDNIKTAVTGLTPAAIGISVASIAAVVIALTVAVPPIALILGVIGMAVGACCIVATLGLIAYDSKLASDDKALIIKDAEMLQQEVSTVKKAYLRDELIDFGDAKKTQPNPEVKNPKLEIQYREKNGIPQAWIQF